MTLVPRQTGPRFLQRGKAATLVQGLYVAGAVVAPTVLGSSYSLFDADGATVVNGGAITVDASTREARYALAGSELDDYELPQRPVWRERWVLVVAGQAESPLTVEREVIVCRVAPVRVIVDRDLFGLHSDWQRIRPPNRSSYDEPIEEAWTQLTTQLLADQVLPNRILNSWALRTCHLYWSAHLVCNDFATAENGVGKWSKLADRYWERASMEFAKIGLRKDSDEDGVASSDKLEPAEPELFFTDVPDFGDEAIE